MDNLNVSSAAPRSLPANTDIGRVSAFSSTTVVEAAYKQIKGEIEVLEATITAWKGRYNTLSIIARLPPEILSIIFKCVASATQASCNPVYHRISWIKLTHVCTHWRRVALECPSLWTTIPLAHPRWAEEMLARSREAPLTIVADVVPHKNRQMELVQSVITRMHQIQKLSLTQRPYSSSGGPLEKILADLVNPAPLLESLSVVFNRTNNIPTPPLNLFSGEAPRLRELELRDCLVAWDAPFLRTLTSLKMAFIPPVARPTMGQIIAALGSMPNLEILDLSDILPRQGTSTMAISEPIISLPHLTQLHVESDAPECEFLLNHLNYPPSASTTIICIVRYQLLGAAEVSCHLPSVRGFCEVLSKSQLVRCLMARYLSYPKSIQLITYDVPGTCLKQPKNAQVDLTLKVESPRSGPTLDDSWADLLQTLWSSIPLKDMESLHVTQNINSPDWSHIFTSLAATKLKRLKVAGNSGIKFLQALSPVVRKARTKQQTPLKISSLRELAIEGWDFDEDNCVELLKTCLEDRRKRRAAIHELFINNCHHISHGNVGILEKFVKKVTWDGDENFTEDEEDEEDGYECCCGLCDRYGDHSDDDDELCPWTL